MHEPTPPPKGTNPGVLIFTAMPALAFLVAGMTKLRGSPDVAASFAGWGYPPWFAFLTGVIEVAGAVALFVPRVAPFAAALLGCTMVGAVVTHLSHGEARHVGAPLLLLVWVVAVGYARRASLVSLFSRDR